MAVYDIGSGTATGGSGTTVVVTVGSTGANYVGSARQLPAVGDVIAVFAGTNNAAGVTSVADSKGNTYTQQVTNSASAGNRVSLFTATCGSAMTTSDTITVTYGTTAGGKSAVVFGVQGGASATLTNTANNFNASGTQPGSGTTGALTLPKVVLACFGTASGGGAPTGYTFGGGDITQVNPGGGMYLSCIYDLEPPSAGENAQCTIVAAAWGALVAAVTIKTYTATGTVASKKAALAGSGTYTPPAGSATGTGAIASKKITLAGAGNVGGASGTGAIASKKVALAGAGSYTAPVTGTGSVHSKKIQLAGTGLGPVAGTGAVASKKVTLAGTANVGGASGTGAVASKKAKLAGTGTYTAPVTGTGGITSKKIILAGTGLGPVSGTGTITSKKIILAGTGTFGSAITGTGTVHSKKIILTGSGTSAPPVTGTGALHSKKIILTGSGTYAPATTGTGAVASKKIVLAGLATVGPAPDPVSGFAEITSKKIILFGTGFAGDVSAPPAAQQLGLTGQLIPVYWGKLSLNDGDRPDGLCTVVTNVEGWYGSPPLNGNDLDRALDDGSVYGFKTAGARVVTITGAATGDRGLLNQFARVLSGQAVDTQPAELVIGEDQGDADGMGTLAADVRADSDTLSLAWTGRNYFTYQVALTAGDPRLYEGNLRTVILTPLAASTPTGRAYPWTPTRVYASSELSNDFRLTNAGSVPAPVLIAYNGPLSESRLTDGTSTIHLAAVGSGVTIYVESETLNATAPGGATRASYLMAGSVPLLLPPFSDTTWSLYGTGTGTVTLAWRGAWG